MAKQGRRPAPVCLPSHGRGAASTFRATGCDRLIKLFRNAGRTSLCSWPKEDGSPILPSISGAAVPTSNLSTLRICAGREAGKLSGTLWHLALKVDRPRSLADLPCVLLERGAVAAEALECLTGQSSNGLLMFRRPPLNVQLEARLYASVARSFRISALTSYRSTGRPLRIGRAVR